ncbi:hypothetical protein ACJX0J_015038, partial [Zea mays]
SEKLGGTLMEQLAKIEPVLEDLRHRRDGRVKEFKAIQSKINGRLQKIDIQTNSIHEMCNIMSIDLKMALKDVHSSYAELGGSKPMSISNNSLDKLSKKVHVLNHEKKQRLRK